MKNRWICVALFLIIWLSLAGCTYQDVDKKGGEAVGKTPLAVEIAAATTSDVSEGVEVVGSLSPKFEADVKSEYLGIVTEVYVTEWVRVKKGMPLAKLDTREADTVIKKLQATVEMAKANLLEAETASLRALREYERSKNLKEHGLITQQNLDDADTAKAAAQARVGAAKAQLKAAEEDLLQGETRLSKALIRSPMDGVIALRAVNVGDLAGEVGTTRVMFKIVDNRLLNLTVNVPSPEAAALRVGQPLIFSTDAVPGRIFSGRVKFINPAVNQLDRSLRVIAEVPNVPEVLKGGLFVQGRIIINQKKGVLQAPRTAFSSWDMAGRTGKLFVAEDNTARLRRVKTGLISGDNVEIVSGLSAGEKIIVRGGFNVKDGDPVKIIDHQGDK